MSSKKDADSTTPALSIVVPVFNVESYIEECLNSVLAQTFDDYEIIVIDDGSTDGSGDICEEYSQAYKNIRVLHKPNGGLSDARNWGIKHSSGKYLMFLDSDDILLHSEVLSEIAFEIGNSQVDFVFGRFVALAEETCPKRLDREFDRQIMASRSVKVLLQYLSDTWFYRIAWRYIVSKQLVIDKQLYFSKGLLHEDEDWTPRLLTAASTFTYLEKPFYGYRMRSDSITSQKTEKHRMSRLTICKNLDEYALKEVDADKARFLRKSSYDLFISEGLDREAGLFWNWVKANKIVVSRIVRYSRICSFLVQAMGPKLGLWLYLQLRCKLDKVRNK